MNNWINRTHIAMVLNVKRGWSRPVKLSGEVRCVNELRLKLRFGSLQITFRKHANIAAVKAA